MSIDRAKMLTIDEVVELYGIQKQLLYFWRTRTNDCGPTFLTIDGVVYYPRSIVDKWVKTRPGRKASKNDG